MNFVAPGITLQDYNEGKGKPIDLFEGRVKHWILAYAKHLAHDHERKENAGIAVLILASSIFEPLGGVLPLAKGRRNSEANFCNGFVRAFPEVPGAEDSWRVSRRVCDLLRDALFHEGFIKQGLALTTQEEPILVRSGLICINAVRFLDAVDSAFLSVCSEIRSADEDSPIRQAFDAYWNKKESDQAKYLEPLIRVEPAYPPALTTSTLSPGPLDKSIKPM